MAAEAPDPWAALPVVTPSELGRHVGTVRLGGRFVGEHAGVWRVIDSFAAADVELAPTAAHPMPEPGVWMVVRGESDGVRVRAAVLEATSPGRFEPRGETARFARVGRHLRMNAQARSLARHHFDAQGFLEVTTPVRVEAPGTDPYLEPHPTGDGWLITSPEFHMKRLLAGGLPKIYQLAPCSRDGESGPWHQPEFWMLEWYRAFADVEQVMRDTEELVCRVVETLAESDTLRVGERKVRVRAPFERVTVRDAFRRHAGIEDAAELARADEDRYFELLVGCVEPALAHSSKPVFLTDYPASQAALARRCSADPSVAERFELYLGGVELCNGYGELTDPHEQRARFERDLEIRHQRGLPELPLDEALLAALHEGLPPCAGNALGFERLVALASGAPLRDVVAFPR